MSVIDVKVPDIGDFKDVPIIEVHVKPGDSVKRDDPLITLESDKAAMEVPAPEAGKVAEILVKVGDKVSEGSAILKMYPAAGATAKEPAPAPPNRKPDAHAPPPPAAPAPAAEKLGPPPRVPLPPGLDFGGVHASPSVRRLARELDIDLTRIEGTGEKGRITKDDVKRALSGSAPQGGMGIPQIPPQDFAKFGPVETRAMSRLKRLAGPHLHRAWLNIPHVTHTDEADITDLEAYRKTLDAAAKEKGYRVTLLAFLMKASVVALKEFPEFNASLAPDKESLILKRYYNLGVAVDTPDGLVVPVIREVDRKGILELSQELGAISAKMREGKIAPADIQGGTFSISSLGGIGGTSFTPIVNAPEVAILGVVKAALKPKWDGAAFQPRLMVPLCLSYDHRVIDGALAARFTRRLADVLEDVRQLVLWIGEGSRMDSVEIRVPDIGDFKDVPVIEVHVGPGSDVRPEDPLITLESDKATMEVPAPQAGKVVEVFVKTGDKVSEGTPILRLDVAGAATGTDATRAPSADAAAPSAVAHPATAPLEADISCDVVVLGAGPGGYSAAFRAADLGLKTVLIERYPKLGGVCLNVGCIPSKALLHVAAVMDEAASLSSHGITFAAPKVDLDALRRHKDKVVGKLTSGLAGMAKWRNVSVIQGAGRFLDPHRIEIALASGGQTIVKFEKAIIAVGSEAVRLPFLPDDPRIVDSTGALELPGIPRRMLVIGGGIIGLEMATVYATLGSRIDVVEMLDGLMAGADRDLVAVWQKHNAKRFDRVMLKTKATAAGAKKDGIHVRFDGPDAPKDSQVYDLVLAAVGRTPNGKRIGAERAGVNVDERGFISVNRQMRTNVAHIFAIGDAACAPMLAHKAVHEGHVAAEAAAGKNSHFDARQIPSVAYTDPEIAWAGRTEDELKAEGAKFAKAVFPWAASGRAIANARSEGFTKLLFEEVTHRIIGGGIVGAHAGDLISEICLAIEMGADATDIGKTIHPHPTLSESIGMAAEVFEGICTDLPRK